MLKQSLLFAGVLAALTLTTMAVSQEKHQHNEEAHAMPTDAVCLMMPTKGSKVEGTITLKQIEGAVHFTGKIMHLTPGQHGFHIHEFGDLRDPEGKSAGGHFNPEGEMHGAPDSEHRHAGDLGNVTAGADGTAIVDVRMKGLKVHFVLGRSLVVHGGKDDLKSQPSGDAGPRVGVGVIGIAKAEEPEK